MSIQDHLDRAEQFLEAFPIVEESLMSYFEFIDDIEEGEENFETENKEEMQNIMLGDIKLQLATYIQSLPIKELKNRLGLLEELNAVQGFLFWQPTYAILINFCKKEVYKALGSIGGKKGGKIAGAINKAKGSEYFKKIRKGKIK